MGLFNDWNQMAKINKAKYPPGTRIELISMNDPHHPVESGTRGTVDFVDDGGNIHMKWDNGRSLALCSDADEFRKLRNKHFGYMDEDSGFGNAQCHHHN